MKRSSKIIIVLITAAITYGSLLALMGPPKHGKWRPGYHFDNYRHHHDSTVEGPEDQKEGMERRVL